MLARLMAKQMQKTDAPTDDAETTGKPAQAKRRNHPATGLAGLRTGLTQHRLKVCPVWSD